MFFPKAMTELELVVPAKDLLAVTKVLSGHGVFQQTDSAIPAAAGKGGTTNWQETAATYAALERRIQAILQTLGIDEGQPPASDFESMADLGKIGPAIDEIEREVRETSDQLTNERKRIEQLEATLNQLEPVSDVDLDIAALRNSRYLYSMLGLIPAANVERLQTSLARIPYIFLTLRSDSQKPVVFLAGTRSNADVLERAARSAYLNPLTLPEEYSGKPAEIIQSIRNTIESSKRKIEDAQQNLARLAETRGQQLRDLAWQAHTSRVLSDAIVRYGQLRHTYVITGWVPVVDLDHLVERLKQASREIIIESIPTTRSRHPSNVPVALLTNKYLKPFQMLVNTYARPQYGELDPTLLFAFTFPFLYGAMFGDLGQGLVLLVLGLLIHNKVIMKGMSSLGLLIAYCGASAAIFGVLYGSVFGFEGEHFEKTFGFPFHPLWLSPIDKNNILQVLILAIDIGIVMLVAGYLLGIFNHFRARNWPHLVLGHTGILGLLFYLSFLGLLGSVKLPIVPKIATAIGALPLPFPILALIFGLGIMFSDVLMNLMEGHRPLIDGRGVGGFIMYLVQAFMNLFETLISQLSNTLSYVRVGAFAVAHGGLSLAIFNLAGDTPNLGFWLTILIGNVIIILLEGLIVGIQTMRLHYYEFLGKFFTGGGTRFEPLRITPAKEEG